MVALGAAICLQCYEREADQRPTALDHLHGCPSCGQPCGARYGQERICWPCFTKRWPALTRRPRRRRKPSEFERLFLEIWDRMEADGYAATTGDGPVVIVGYCPRCRSTMVARLLDNPIEIEFECRGGCTPQQVAAQLGKRRARAA